MIRIVQLDSGERFFVEVDDTAVVADDSGIRETAAPPADGLPEGAREVSATGAAAAATQAGALLHDQLSALATMSRALLAELEPDEICIEAHVKFASDVTLIPFIASAKGDGGLKITLTWKDEKDEPE